jgi:streptogramin lyase
VADEAEMESIKRVKRREMEEDNTEIEEIFIPQLQTEDTNMEEHISKISLRYQALEETADCHRNEWHQEVDQIFNQFHKEIRNTKEDDIAMLQNIQLRIRKMLLDIPQIVRHNTEVLRSGNNSNEILQYKSKLTVLKNTLPKFETGVPTLSTPPVQVGRGLCVEFREIKSSLVFVNSLDTHTAGQTSKKFLERVVVKADFSSGVENLHRMVYIGRNEIWLSGKGGILRQMNIHGIDLETVEALNTKFQDISATSEGEVIYSDYLNRCVNIVKGTQTETLLVMPDGWHPQGILQTDAGHILITLRTAGDCHCKIVRYEGQNITQEIQYNKHGKPLFSSGYKCVFLAENKNGDICASDTNSNSLVVVDKNGVFRFQYQCDPALRRKPFVPDQIVTDSLCQILLTDYVNSCLHVFHKDGQYLRCICHPDIELPTALTIDRDDRLWIGLYVSGNVKVMQYMK